jgi:hypothetical protein
MMPRPWAYSSPLHAAVTCLEGGAHAAGAKPVKHFVVADHQLRGFARAHEVDLIIGKATVFA